MKTIILSLTLLFTLTALKAQNQFKKNKKIIEKVENLTSENLFNLDLMETQEWRNFMSHMKSNEVLSLETMEFGKTFNRMANNLSFSHYYLGFTNKKSKKQKVKKKPFELEEIDSETVILHLRKFAADPQAMMKIVEKIKQKNYNKLIIDLRNNSGGTLDAAVILGQFLTNKTIDAGAYVTRKWYETTKKTPTLGQIQKFKHLQGFTYQDFLDIQDEPAFRMVIPGHQNEIFGGQVIVLTNHNTASACEPFVHILKIHNAATIVGEKTAGQMLSANWFKINKDLSIFIPTNDYLTAEGFRLDKIGVTPHVLTTSEEALEKALEQLKY